MVVSVIEELLRRLIGLDSASIGVFAIERSVRRRMAECRMLDEQSYLELLKTSPAEVQSLIDEVTIPETWFFRGVEPFRLLAEYVSTEWRSAHPGQPFRVLSVPCSSGEEPYSIAMVLMDIGLDKGQFHIDAIDISTRIISRARTGIYGRNSFRGDEGDAVDRYFHVTGDRYEINDVVRGSVNFIHGNILDRDLLHGMQVYDAIFCRNLLIYFDRGTQADALVRLHGLLAEKGMLFVGHAESGCVDHALFSLIRRSGAFAYVKNVGRVDAVPAWHAPGNGSSDKNDIKHYARPKTVSVPSTDKPARSILMKEAVYDKDDLLAAVAQLVNRGELEEAARLCDKRLAMDVYSVDAYYFLGVVREAQGNASLARELFHKVLYLDPQHYQALIHLAHHAESHGDLATADAYRARARRLVEEARAAMFDDWRYL